MLTGVGAWAAYHLARRLKAATWPTILYQAGAGAPPGGTLQSLNPPAQAHRLSPLRPFGRRDGANSVKPFSTPR
jgi:hypothetical protein